MQQLGHEMSFLLKKLDVYIIRKFFESFLFVLFIIMTLAVIFDLSENYREIKGSGLPFSSVLIEYYLYFAIHYSHLFANLLMFITVIFFTSKMAADTEIVAMLGNGVSFDRLLRPYFISALILFGITLYSNHLLLPFANSKKFDFESVHIRKTKKHYDNVYKEFEKNKYINLDWFNFETLTAEKMRLQYLDEQKKMAEEINSKYAVFNPETEIWTLHHVLKRYYKLPDVDDPTLAENPLLEELSELELKIPFTVRDIIQTADLAANLDTPELVEFIKTERERGNEKINLFSLEYHRRTAFPFSTFILMLIAVLFSAQKSRNSTDLGLNLAIGLFIAVTYVFIMQVATVAVTNVKFDPMIAAWLPNFIFTPLAIFVYFKKREHKG